MYEITDEARKVYSAARRIADSVFGQVKQGQTLRDWRDEEELNPYVGQTTGLFLEFVNGIHSNLWTPWGRWHFCGGGTPMDDEQINGVMGHLTATVFRLRVRDGLIGAGPVYAILAIDGEELPQPTFATRPEWLRRETAVAAWQQLTSEWQKQANGLSRPPD